MLLGDFERLGGRNDPQLIAFFIDKTDFLRLYLVVNLMAVVACDFKTPP